MKKILITVGAGFIGSHLAGSLSKKFKVIILDNLFQGNKLIVNKNIKLIVGDVRDKKEEERLDFVPESMDIVIDDAGIHKRSLQEGLLATMWKYVKPGGYYIMEDVDGKRGGFDYETNHSLSSSTIGILENNHAFMVNRIQL